MSEHSRLPEDWEERLKEIDSETRIEWGSQKHLECTVIGLKIASMCFETILAIEADQDRQYSGASVVAAMALRCVSVIQKLGTKAEFTEVLLEIMNLRDGLIEEAKQRGIKLPRNVEFPEA